MKIGRELPNGATVVAYAESQHDAVVMAKNNSEWVTWMMRPNEFASTYWGHYFTEYKDAADDFADRIKRCL